MPAEYRVAALELDDVAKQSQRQASRGGLRTGTRNRQTQLS